MQGSTISFVYFEIFFLKIPTVKKFSPGGFLLPSTGRSIDPKYTKTINYLTIAIINKCFEFQNDWLKIIYIEPFHLYTQEKGIGFVKIFHIRFSINLHVLRCPEHDSTIFRKCLSVCLYISKLLWALCLKN